MSCLNSISPFQLIIISAILALLISEGKDENELNTLGNLIVAIGSLVLTAAAQKEYLISQEETKDSKNS